MQKIYLIILTISALIYLECSAIAQPYRRFTRQEYIEHYARLAIEEMNEYHIPASITMAQACLESADGNSTLARNSNNHFGIKCKSNWTGQTVNHDDDERGECFRKYDSPIESFRDHSRFLVESDRYQFLFSYNITDYRRWAHGLKRAGYATDPNYPARLIKIIEDFQLNELDRYYKSGTGYAGIQRRGFGTGRGYQGSAYSTRPVYERNKSRAFYAKPGDTYEGIAREFNLKEWEIFNYNDCSKGSRPEENSIVYISSKRGKAPRGNEYHLFREGESMWAIAQWYGIRLNSLYRINNMKKNDEPYPGQRISLRKKVKK